MAVQSSLFIERLYQEMEMEMLKNIGKVIGEGLDITDDEIVQWQVEKLSQLGMLRKEQLKVLAEHADMTVGQMKEYIHDQGYAEIEAFDGRMKALVDAGVDYIPPSNTVYERLLALENQSEDVMNMINSNMISGSDQIYRDIITKTSSTVLTGQKTPYQAARDTIKEWSRSGIPVLTDKAGRQWSTEGYVSMVIRNTQKNTALEMQNARMDEYDIDLLEISSHAGSRPSHIPFQGRIYSRSGNSKKYPALSTTTYGEIDGILTGIGCTHKGYPYVEGIHTKRHEPFNKKESVEKYEESQKQRYLEREIRRAKKEKSALEAMGAKPEDITKANQKIRDKQANMREFIKGTGRTRRRTAEQIV